jgi:predicted nucleic acid-binding protein
MQTQRFFIDTNIIVYAFENNDPMKQKRARDLIEEALENGNGVISYQVVQEFVNLATRKFSGKIKPEDLRDFLAAVLFTLLEVYPSKDLFNDALYVHERYGYSFYDSLIIAGALNAGCTILYSEDLQHDQKIRNMIIQNPFSV